MSFNWNISKEWQEIPWALGIYSAEEIKLSIKCTIVSLLHYLFPVSVIGIFAIMKTPDIHSDFANNTYSQNE